MLDLGRARAVVGDYLAVEATADVSALLDDDSVEAVAIATPAATHYQVAMAAIEAGKHVLVEKPLAASYAEGESLVCAAEEQGGCAHVRPHLLLHPRGAEDP